MSQFRLGIFIALVLAASVSAQNTQIAYTLELGGNNNASGWANPPGCIPPMFTPGSPGDGQIFAPGQIITWAVRVAVTGTHGNGFPPSGAANLVFNLELQNYNGSAWVTTPFPRGSSGTKGWFSTINDGVTGKPRNLPPCNFPNDPLQLAAMCVSYDVAGTGQHGRVIDKATAGAGVPGGGPYLDYFQYPSALNFPTGSTAPTGKLLGMGAGYSKYQGTGGGGLNTAGVGKAIGGPNCSLALGTGPVFEGQMNTTGLFGNYRLVLTPGTGNNILNGNFACATANPGSFALRPESSTVGDTRSFVLQPTSWTVTAWRSVRSHSGTGNLSIVLDPARSGNGTSGPVVETRGTTSLGMGLRTIQVDFDNPVTLVNPGNVTCTYRQTTGCPSACVMGSAVPYVPTVTMANFTTLNIALSGPDEACYTVTIGAGTFSETISGPTVCSVRSLVGDGNMSGDVALSDALLAKSKIGQPVTSWPHVDYNLASGILLSDALLAKSKIGKKAFCP